MITPRFRTLALGLSLLLASTALQATSVVPPDFPELVNESDYVVRAKVKAVSSERRTENGQTMIYTKVELDVVEAIAGTPPEPLVLSLLGGKVGDERLVVEGAPTFAVGEEDILFVSGNERTIVPLYAMMHGRYPVMRESGTGREYVARNNKVPLQDTAEVALPMAQGPAAEMQQRMKSTATALTPAQFTQKIKAAIDPSYRRAKLH